MAMDEHRSIRVPAWGVAGFTPEVLGRWQPGAGLDLPARQGAAGRGELAGRAARAAQRASASGPAGPCAETGAGPCRGPRAGPGTAASTSRGFKSLLLGFCNRPNRQSPWPMPVTSVIRRGRQRSTVWDCKRLVTWIQWQARSRAPAGPAGAGWPCAGTTGPAGVGVVGPSWPRWASRRASQGCRELPGAAAALASRCKTGWFVGTGPRWLKLRARSPA